MIDPRPFGQALRSLRRQRKLTQENLAEMIDRSVDAVSHLERGQNLPSLDTLVRISEALYVPLAELAATLTPEAPADAERAPYHAIIQDTTRRLTLRDLKIVTRIVKAFPEQS